MCGSVGMSKHIRGDIIMKSVNLRFFFCSIRDSSFGKMWCKVDNVSLPSERFPHGLFWSSCFIPLIWNIFSVIPLCFLWATGSHSFHFHFRFLDKAVLPSRVYDLNWSSFLIFILFNFSSSSIHFRIVQQRPTTVEMQYFPSFYILSLSFLTSKFNSHELSVRTRFRVH